MLNCGILKSKAHNGVKILKTWYGNLYDTTNFTTDRYLQINSCGFQNVSAGYMVIRENGRYDYHILLMNSGTCEVLHKDKLYALTAGNLVIYAPNEKQQYTFRSESTTLWCHFNGTIIKELLESCDVTSGVYFLNSNKIIFEAYSNVIQRFHQPGRERFANASLLELIYSISNSVTHPAQKDQREEIVLPILAYINANYNKQISLDELAKLSGYSKSRFSHIFSEITGVTPMKYLNDIRLKVSCEMLSSTDYHIADIAFSCGFNDPLYYSKMFKNKYNVTPTQYRTLILNT